MVTSATPSLSEMLARARRGRLQSPPVWLSSEVRTLESAREMLRLIPVSSPPEALFDTIHQCFPFEAGMLETICESRPTELVDAMHHVPDGFNRTRAHIIEHDPAIPLVLGLEAGVAFRGIDVVPEPLFLQHPYVQVLYPNYGFGGVTCVIVSIKPRGLDKEHVSLWLFHETNGRVPKFHECRMLEALHDDIRAALERMRLPLLPHRSIEFQILEEKNDGYVLLRGDRSVFEANRRAFVFSDVYAPQGNRCHRREPLAHFAHSVEQMSQTPSCTRYLRRSDGRALLEVSIINLAKVLHEIPEDLVLVRMSEVPLESSATTEAGRRLLAALSPRLQDIAHLLITTQLTAKEIASRLGTSHRTVETQTRNIYAAVEVRSRAQLKRLLTDG